MVSAAIKRRLFAALPTPMRVQGRDYLRNCFLDLSEYLTGQADRGIPPHRLNTSGGGPFRLYGQRTVQACRELAGLRPDDSFLDVGCGIGRTAVALAGFLSPGAAYLGFDVIPFAIDWCNRNIARKHPNFRFVHADLHNWVYNPTGKLHPDSYRFPAGPAEFRFALASSLFTHLGAAAARHYIAEAGRVLAPGARFLSTWFLLDEVTQATATAASRFPHRSGECAYASLHAPEQAVAFDREWVESTLRENGFLVEAAHHGEWSGAPRAADSFQDQIVALRS